MSTTTQRDEGAIREQAYLLWEQDGKPFGRDTEYWMRAKVLVTEKDQMDTLTKVPPKKRAAAEKATTKTVKAAASAAKAAPAKTAKPAAKAKAKVAPKGKPKKQ
jgi:hypothetical protein